MHNLFWGKYWGNAHKLLYAHLFERYLAGTTADAFKLIHAWAKVELEHFPERGARIGSDVEANDIRHGFPVSGTNPWVAHYGDHGYILLQSKEVIIEICQTRGAMFDGAIAGLNLPSADCSRSSAPPQSGCR